MAVRTAVLLPGLDGTGDLFDPFVGAAPSGMNTVVVDYPVDEARIEALERRAREKLTDRCIVVAESFSGPIGVRLAADARVQALVLCNSFVSSPHPAWLRHIAMSPIFAFPLPPFLLRSILLGRQASPALVQTMHQVIRRVPAKVIARRVQQVLQADERVSVRSLAKPILYLRGVRDNLLSENSWRDLHAICPDAQMARVQGPHLLLQTSPRECWEAIMKFVESV